jgi:chromosome segregation ATPase
MDIENESLKSEKIMMKKINKNLKEEIQKYKEGDILQNKKETELLKSTISDLEKKYNETSNKFQNLQSDFNHDFGISKKIRLILNYLINNNKSLEEKINELNIMKEKSQQKEAQLQQMLIDKNSKIEQKEKIIEEEKKKLNEEKLKYIQLNNEYNNLLKLSQVEELNNKYENETEHNKNIRNSFSDLTVLLNKNKEIIPFLNNRLEIVEKENKNLKEQINKLNKYDIEKNNEIVKNKEKEIEDLKNQINKMNIKNDNLTKENNMLKTENDLIKGDIRLIGNSMNKIEEKNEQKKNEDEENSLNEILNQLIKSRNIISFLLNEK